MTDASNATVVRNAWPDFDTSSFRTRRYTYSDLKNIVPETVVDIYGVVKFFKLPQKTRGTDYRQLVSIIDPSFCGTNKLTCLLFAKDEASLPPVKIGSIIRFHRLKVGRHNGELQAMKAAGFSWLVVDANARGPIVQKASTTNYTFSDVDREKIKNLQQWIQEQEDPKSQEQSLCLEKIVPGGYFNLVCQVVSVCLLEENVCLLLQVWDGTSPDYPVREVEGVFNLMSRNEELFGKAADRIYDVCLFDDHVKEAEKIKPGTFVKLYNLHAAKYKNDENCEGFSGPEMVELVLHHGSSYGRGMKVLPGSDPEVCTLRGKLQQIPLRPPPTRQQTEQPGCSTDYTSPVCNTTETPPSTMPCLTSTKRPQVTANPTSDPPNQTPQAPVTNYTMTISGGNTEEQSFPKTHKMPNAGLMPVSLEDLENLRQYFETENIKDFLISPEDQEILAAIPEWKEDYRVPENPSEKSGSENPVPVLATTSTLKHQGKSAKVSEEAIVVPPPASIERPDPQEGVAAPRSNTEAEEEEIRLLNLSRVSNKQGRCPPITELEKSFRNYSKKSSKNSSRGVPPPCPGADTETGSSSGTSKALKLNKDSTETSLEILLSGKVASNYNPNNPSKSTSEELFHCSLLDSSEEEARWTHLDLSSLESDTQFELAPRAQNKATQTENKATQFENKATQTTKKIKLSHVSETTCDPRSQDSQGSLLSQPQLHKPHPGSKSLTLEMISESSSSELIKSVPQEESAANKVPAVNSCENLPVLNSLVATTLSPMNVSSDSEEEEEAQPIQIYATIQELFPKHAACASLLSSKQQLTLENNFNNVCLPKENMEAINTYWSLSHDKKP